MSGGRRISTDELGQHGKPEDCWVAINGTIWDMTEFAPKHPGGVEIIHQYMGQDASKAYNEVHTPQLVSKNLGPSKNMGQIDESTITEEWKAKQASNIESTPQADDDEMPPLDSILNTYDFEAVAEKKVAPKTWAYYAGAANDCLTHESNIDYYRKIWFRPRVMAGVPDVDVSTTILGEKYSMPIFSAPCGMAMLSHPEGEKALARGAVAKGTTICHCYNGSFSLDEVREVIPDNYPIFSQLYFNKDRNVTQKIINEFNKYKSRAILVTVDLPVVGKREADERIKMNANQHTGRLNKGSSAGDKKGSGLARATGSTIDPALCWEDIKWIKSLTNIPIFLKGIQCAADARRALQCGVAGIYLSNHGGRAVDTAQPSILTLMEINANCPEVLEQMEVFIDGGIRRGTDILKAICLGASAVCLGRPFLYATVYGQEGVEHCFELLRDELETAMQMCGITKLSQAHPGLLNTAELDRYVYRGDVHPWAKKIVRQAKL